MPIFRSREPIGALEDLLDKERLSILSGEFGGLRRFLAEKERLLQGIGTPEDGANLRRVKQKADRNQMMLQAAARGMRAISDRLANRATETGRLQTYDRAGQRILHGHGGGNLERRA